MAFPFSLVLSSALTELGLNFARITLGARLDFGLLQKGVKNIQSCVRKCIQSGGGLLTAFTGADLPTRLAELGAVPQLCFGIDYDFSTHKCFFHTAANIFDTDEQGVLQAAAAVPFNPGGVRCYTQEDGAVRTNPLGPTNLIPSPSSINIVICE